MNFLIATWEGGGSVTPALTVASKLVGRGHRVRVMSDAVNRPESEATGAAFVPWTRAPSRADRSRDSDIFRDWEVATPQEGFARVLHRLWTGPALAYAEDYTKVSHPSFKPGSNCANCQFFTAATGGCTLFPGFKVPAAAWCSAWAKKA